MNILIVDDEQLAIDELRSELEDCMEQDITFFSANRYKQAIEIFEKEHFDIVFLDIEIPGKNGIEVLKKINEISPFTNVIIVSAYSDYAIEAVQNFVSGYLLKPVMKNKLQEALGRLRYPIEDKALIDVTCFGDFSVKAIGAGRKPLHFKRSKARELFAFLVVEKGSPVSGARICTELWPESFEDEKNKAYVRKLLGDIRQSLAEIDATELLVRDGNQIYLDTELIHCDYYDYLKHEHHGPLPERFLEEFSWAGYYREDQL